MDKKCLYCGNMTNSEYKFCPECGHSLAMTKEEVLKLKAAEGDPDAQRELDLHDDFTQSVIRFADAFLALTPEEQDELIAYTEGRCAQAEQEYKKTHKK